MNKNKHYHLETKEMFNEEGRKIFHLNDEEKKRITDSGDMVNRFNGYFAGHSMRSYDWFSQIVFDYYSIKIFENVPERCFYMPRVGKDSIIDYSDVRLGYIRDCYFRILSEIFYASSYFFISPPPPRYNRDSFCGIVTGNPGIGKSSLSFLYIRILLELGVKNISHKTNFLEVEFTQEASSLSISTTIKGENPFVCFYRKNLLFPVFFLTDDMKRKFSELVDVDKRYLILDDIKIFPYLSLSQKKVMILFTSPNKERFTETITHDIHKYNFGMELWEDNELRKVREVLSIKESETLCNKGSDEEKRMNFFLRKLPSMENADASTLYRVDFFGMQPRFLFGSEGLVMKGLERISSSLLKLLTEYGGALLDPTETGKDGDIAPHRLIQMEYYRKTKSFYRSFVSRMMCDIMYKFFEHFKRDLLDTLVQRAVEPYESLHYPFFEKDALMKINTGFKGNFRELEDNYKQVNTFEYGSGINPARKIKYFYHKYRGRFCTFHFGYGETELLGYNIIKYMLEHSYSKMVLAPCYEECPVIDGVSVSITKYKYGSDKKLVAQNVKVDFIQVTTGKTHGVSPSGLFAMLVMLASIKSYVNTVEVNFFFVVSEEMFMIFESEEASLLYTLFKEYGIKVKVVVTIENINITNHNSIDVRKRKIIKDQNKKNEKTKKVEDVIITDQNPMSNVDKKEEKKITETVKRKPILKKKKKKDLDDSEVESDDYGFVITKRKICRFHKLFFTDLKAPVFPDVKSFVWNGVNVIINFPKENADGESEFNDGDGDNTKNKDRKTGVDEKKEKKEKESDLFENEFKDMLDALVETKQREEYYILDQLHNKNLIETYDINVPKYFSVYVVSSMIIHLFLGIDKIQHIPSRQKHFNKIRLFFISKEHKECGQSFFEDCPFFYEKINWDQIVRMTEKKIVI